jgi:5-methylcytosine-specific restriction enzyme subunit McrC
MRSSEADDIPIRNVFYMLSYAWNEFEAGKLVDLEGVPSESPVGLLGHVLVEATKRLIRQGLDRGYQSEQREVAGVRGQITFNASLSRMSFSQGQAVCRVDELSHDVLRNRILVATLRRLGKFEELDGDIRDEATRLVRRMPEVTGVELHPQVFSRVQIGRNSGFYRFVLAVCRLIVDSSHLNEATGRYQFEDFLRDDARMHAVFEAFVRNFYRHECPEYSVNAEEVSWNVEPVGSESERLLPGMRTDVTLRGEERVMVIDTKFYRSPLSSYQGSEKLRSDHLMQMFSYMQSIETSGEDVEGMLLYPTVDRGLDVAYEFDEQRLRVCTLALDQSWQGIREQLLALVAC